MSTDAIYTVSKLPTGRVITNNALVVWSAHHSIHGLVEVDVTEARQRMRAHRMATGESLSMTAFVIHCFAIAVSREQGLNAVVRHGKVYAFETVNVATMVERDVSGEKVISAVVIRNAERKTVREIHAEIRQAQTQPINSAGDITKLGWIEWLPGWLMRLVVRVMHSKPQAIHKFGGITGVTAVGMFTSGIGWGLPITPNTVMLTIGGIGERPAIEAGQLVERETLCLTISFDHEVVDGAPAARFVTNLKKLLSDAEGLGSLEVAGQTTARP